MTDASGEAPARTTRGLALSIARQIEAGDPEWTAALDRDGFTAEGRRRLIEQLRATP